VKERMCRVCMLCVRAKDRMGANERGGEREKKRTYRVRHREKAPLYVAIIETMSVIILRIERQYKQSPYVTT